MNTKTLFEQEIQAYTQLYNRLRDNYVLNVGEIETLSSYTTCRVAATYLSNFMNSRKLFGDEDLMELFTVDLDILLDSFIEGIYYGYVAYELVYEPLPDGRIALSKMIKIPYRLINRYSIDAVFDGDQLIVGTVKLEPLKYVWFCFNDPEPYGHSILSCDMSKLILEARKIKASRDYYVYRKAYPLYLGKVDGVENGNRFINAVKGLKDGLTGLIVGRDDEVSILQEKTDAGALFNETLKNIDDEILLLHNLTPNLIKNNSVGSYSKASIEQDLLYDNLNNYILSFNKMLKQLCNKLADINDFVYTNSLTLALFNNNDYQKVFMVVKEIINPSSNSELYTGLINSMLGDELDYNNELPIVFDEAISEDKPAEDKPVNDDDEVIDDD